MPEYEYRCRHCQKVFSIERPMNASSEETAGNCSHCGSTDLARIWGANFVAAGTKQGASSSAAESTVCASNPSQPKSCCPCS
jgi:putative FmdB family regulatory protein